MVSILLISCCTVSPSPVSFGAPARADPMNWKTQS